MEYRRLGTSGLKVSNIGLGGNNFGARVDAEGTQRVVDQALELGINFIDTANVYGSGRSEEFIGNALKGKRHQALIATKFGREVGMEPNNGGGSRKHIMDQIETSLSRLQTDYIDLYQLHIHDPTTPIEETLRALDDLIRQGKVRYIGCSGVTAWQACEAIWTSKALRLNAFVSVQPHYSLLWRDAEQELIPFCRAYGLGVIPYFPLEGGFLTGKYRPGEPPAQGTRFAGSTSYHKRLLTEENFAILAGLHRFAEMRSKSVGELALAWLLANPTVSTVIPGATKTEQVVANARASDWHLLPEELEQIGEIIQGGTTGSKSN